MAPSMVDSKGRSTAPWTVDSTELPTAPTMELQMALTMVSLTASSKVRMTVHGLDLQLDPEKDTEMASQKVCSMEQSKGSMMAL